MNYNNQHNNFFNDDRHAGSIDAINIWFASDVWRCICDDADHGDEDSLELMQYAYDLLNNLLFHLQNNSDSNRVKYELKQFDQLIANHT